MTPSPNADSVCQFAQDGYFIREAVIGLEEIEQLRSAMSSLPDGEEIRRKTNVYGVRNLFDLSPEVRALAGQLSIRNLVTPILGPRAFAVRAVFFDKVPGANWSLAWHQDTTIAVNGRGEIPGFDGWSQKIGVWHVQPPVSVLANMVAVRVHLDECSNDNGPLRVLPGSHHQIWTTAQVVEWKSSKPEIICPVGCGGVLLMSPLALHASSASKSVLHRRVIHIEFAAQNLPNGLDWYRRIGPASIYSARGSD